MTGDAERITSLRQRTGKGVDEIASLAGLGHMAYINLETYDDDSTVLSLGQVKRLAFAFGVPASALFADETTESTHRVSVPAAFVTLVNGRLASGVSRNAFEESIGWSLGAFFESEAAALSEYGVEFLQELCSRFGIDWIDALP